MTSESNQAKINHYIDLALDQKKLVMASRSIIRKRQSPLARDVSNGNVKTIIRMAKDLIFGSFNKNNRSRLCKIICKFENQTKEKKSLHETLSYIIPAILEYLRETLQGATKIAALMIAIIWQLRLHIVRPICGCELNGACKSTNGNCRNH